MKLRTIAVLLVLAGLSRTANARVKPPEPYGALPTRAQVEWQQMEYYMFVHFGPNTFTDVEWGDGKEDPGVFDPANIDCRQWAATAKAAGMKAIILTAKHHDGFCLWPSEYSTHTVRESPWKDGGGDVLKELSEACREYGLKFGVYLSPWDRNHPAYGTDGYNDVFAGMLGEVLSNYGGVFEQWFDGANGEGSNGKRQVYDWDLFHDVVYGLQPHAVIFSDIGPGCRWMGNEAGVAGETNWSTLNVTGYGPGRDAPPVRTLNTGVQGGEAWVPAETDVSIRPGWFYSPATDDRVKTADKLMDIYYTSVGRNSNLLLNVPPDRNGRIHRSDSIRLMEFRRAREEAFGENLIRGAVVKASDARRGYAAKNMTDGDYDTYWAAGDGIPNPHVEIDLKEPRTFDRLMIQEYIPLGQRVAEFGVEYRDESSGSWVPLVEATTIGYKRILRFPAVVASKIRIGFDALACPVISEIGIYDSPELLSVPVIGRDRDGMVSIRCETAGPVVYYTVDGSEPDERSAVYGGAFAMPGGGIVKAVAVADGTRRSETVTAEYDLAPAGWSVVTPAGGDVAGAIDGNIRTAAEIDLDEALTVDLGADYPIRGFTYTPAARVQAANIYRYDFYVSVEGVKWVQVKSGAAFGNIANLPVQQRVMFDEAVRARYVRIAPTETVGGKAAYLVAEIGVVTRE